MSMKKYLIRKGYTTTGCGIFHIDMRAWQRKPLILDSERIKGRTRITIGRWTIRVEDLVPYIVQLENK